MTMPVIYRIRPYYRVRFSTLNGLKGVDDGGWIIDADQPARNGEVPGVIKPSAFNTGVLFSRARAKYEGPLNLTSSNKVYRDLDFYDYIRVQAPGIQFINCGFYGGTAWPTSALPLVECLGGVDTAATTADPWNGIPYFEGCTFKPQRPNYYTDGILGSFVAVECQFLNLRHGVTINSSDDTRRARARLEACYISDLVFWHPMPNGSSTVNHGVNIIAAGDIRVVGNYIRSTSVKGDDRNFIDPDGVAAGGQMSSYNPAAIDQFTQVNGPHASGAGVKVTQTRTIAYSSTVVIEKNWLAYGMMGAELFNGPYHFQNNKFRLNGFYQRTAQNQYYIKLTFSTVPSIVGLSTNIFEETNQPLTTSNGGIQ